jgi:hypothetical protein
MAGVDVPAIGAWMIGSSIPIRFSKLAAGVECNDRRFTSVPIWEYALKPAGIKIFRNIDLRLQHNAESGERPVVDRIAVVDVQGRGRKAALSQASPSLRQSTPAERYIGRLDTPRVSFIVDFGRINHGLHRYQKCAFGRHHDRVLAAARLV